MKLVYDDNIFEKTRKRFGDKVKNKLEKKLEQFKEWCDLIQKRGKMLKRFDRTINQYVFEKYLNVKGKSYRMIFILYKKYVVLYEVISKKRKRKQDKCLSMLGNNTTKLLNDINYFIQCNQ